MATSMQLPLPPPAGQGEGEIEEVDGPGGGAGHQHPAAGGQADGRQLAVRMKVVTWKLCRSISCCTADLATCFTVLSVPTA